MAEFTNNPRQTVQPNQPVLLNTTIGCPKGYVLHREGSGIVTLRGIVNCPQSCFARYQVTFNGNIAIPTGGTAMFALLAMAGDLGGSIGPSTVGMISQKAGDNLQAGLLFGGIFPVLLVVFLVILKFMKDAE